MTAGRHRYASDHPVLPQQEGEFPNVKALALPDRVTDRIVLVGDTADGSPAHAVPVLDADGGLRSP
jgi:hypothetical protein